MGKDAGIHVDALLGCDAYKEVGTLHSGIFQYADAGWRTVQRHDVIATVKSCQSFYVVIDEHTVLVVL